MRRISIAIVIIILSVSHYAIARPSFELSTDFLSQYIWRGYALSYDSMVIQPSFTILYKGLSLNVWGNFDTDEYIREDAEWNETDYTFSYSRDLLPFLSLTFGSIYYELDETEDSFEIFSGISFDLNYLRFGFTLYREVSHYPGWWLQFDLSKTVELPYGMDLNTGLTLYYQDSDDEDAYPDPDDPTDSFSGWQSALISVTLNMPFSERVTVSSKLMYSFPLSGKASKEIKMLSWQKDDNFIYGGIGVSVNF